MLMPTASPQAGTGGTRAPGAGACRRPRGRLPRALAAGCLTAGTLLGAVPRGTGTYPETVAAHLQRILDPGTGPLSPDRDRAGGFPLWRGAARQALQNKLGLDRIAAAAGSHRPVVRLEEAVDRGDHLRRRGSIETEPGVHIPFWLLEPKGPSQPRPLGLFPHGHDRRGHDTSAGIHADEAQAARARAEDRDVAVQAVRLGFIALAPATRGIATQVIPDLDARHGDRECRSQLMHCLLAGRTALGERVWDVQRLLDWALTLPGADPRRVLVSGNSGGGMVTMFAAACDERFTFAVPSCSFAPSASRAGYIFHCDCNTVPGLLDIGGGTGVVGLIAPRHTLAVNGRNDSLLPVAEVERAAAEVRSLYAWADAAGRFQHRWGPEGHRFYRDLMWPLVLDAWSGIAPSPTPPAP